MRVFLIVRIATRGRAASVRIKAARCTSAGWVRLGRAFLARLSWIYRTGGQSGFAPLIIRLRIIVWVILRMLEHLSRLSSAGR